VLRNASPTAGRSFIGSAYYFGKWSIEANTRLISHVDSDDGKHETPRWPTRLPRTSRKRFFLRRMLAYSSTVDTGRLDHLCKIVMSFSFLLALNSERTWWIP
jgi:hypothetical protein